MSQKSCFKCGEFKPLCEFYPHPKMADGYLGKCKVCTRRDTKLRVQRLRETDLQWIEQEAQRCREKTKRRRLAGWVSPSAKAAKNIWNPQNKLKRIAHRKVAKAIQAGKLIRQPCCICGASKAEAHHDNYLMPLNVRWLCKMHHDQIHLEINKLRRKEQFELRKKSCATSD